MAELDFLDDSDLEDAELSFIDSEFEEAQDGEEDEFSNPFANWFHHGKKKAAPVHHAAPAHSNAYYTH